MITTTETLAEAGQRVLKERADATCGVLGRVFGVEVRPDNWDGSAPYVMSYQIAGLQASRDKIDAALADVFAGFADDDPEVREVWTEPDSEGGHMIVMRAGMSVAEERFLPAAREARDQGVWQALKVG